MLEIFRLVSVGDGFQTPWLSIRHWFFLEFGKGLELAILVLCLEFLGFGYLRHLLYPLVLALSRLSSGANKQERWRQENVLVDINVLHSLFTHFIQFLLIEWFLIHDLFDILLVAFRLLNLSPLGLPWVKV